MEFQVSQIFRSKAVSRQPPTNSFTGLLKSQEHAPWLSLCARAMGANALPKPETQNSPQTDTCRQGNRGFPLVVMGRVNGGGMDVPSRPPGNSGGGHRSRLGRCSGPFAVEGHADQGLCVLVHGSEAAVAGDVHGCAPYPAARAGALGPGRPWSSRRAARASTWRADSTARASLPLQRSNQRSACAAGVFGPGFLACPVRFRLQSGRAPEPVVELSALEGRSATGELAGGDAEALAGLASRPGGEGQAGGELALVSLGQHEFPLLHQQLVAGDGQVPLGEAAGRREPPHQG